MFGWSRYAMQRISSFMRSRESAFSARLESALRAYSRPVVLCTHTLTCPEMPEPRVGMSSIS